MSKNTAYDLMKEMVSIDAEIQALNYKLKDKLSDNERLQIERKIDHLYSDFLVLKHRLDRIEA